MAQTLIERITTLSGLSISSSTSPSSDEVGQMIKDAQQEVFDRVVDLAPEEVELFLAVEDIIPGVGAPVEEGRVSQVIRYDGNVSRVCERIPATMEDLVNDTTSLSYRSKYNPVYFLRNERLFVLPEPTKAEPGTMFRFKLDSTIFSGDTSLDNFPKKYERHVVLYASYLQVMAKLSEKIQEHPDVPAAHTVKLTPSFSVIKPVIPAIPAIISSASFSSPSFTYDFAQLGKVFNGATKTLTGIAPIINIPSMDVPVLETINDVVLPSVPVVPNLDNDYSITFSNLTKPTYEKPGIAITEAPNLSTFTISAVTPGQPPVPSFDVEDVFDTPLAFPVAPTFTVPNIPGTGDELSDINAGEPGGSSDGDHRDLSKLFDIATDYLVTEEDTELQGGVNSQINTITAAYMQQVQVNLNTYNADAAKFQQEIATELNKVQRANQIATSNQQKDMQIQLQQYTQDLAAYQAKQTNFTNELNKEVQQYQIDSQFKMQEWQAKVGNEFNTYNSAIQQELNKFNKENAIFQQEIAIEIQNQNWENQEDQTKLAKYGQEMAKYQGEVATSIQQFQQNEVHNKFTVWNQKYQNELARYSAELGSAQQKFNEQNTEYTAQIQVDMAELNNSQTAFMSQMQQQTQLNTSNEQQETQRQIQEYGQKFSKEQAEFNSNLQRYQAEVATYQAELNSNMQLHQSELQSYASSLQEISSELQRVTFESGEKQKEFQASLGKFNTEYVDLSSRLAGLKDEYDSAFKVRAEAVQKMAAQRQQMAQQQG